MGAARPAVVGAFVLGGLALAVAAILFFGGTRLFAPTTRAVIFFEGSVAGLARALALDPDILFLDEPSAGLDPIASKRLDDLILELRDGLGATVVMVSHELPSLFAICDDGVFLDAETCTAIAHGAPRVLRDGCDHPAVHAFMARERPEAITLTEKL